MSNETNSPAPAAPEAGANTGAAPQGSERPRRGRDSGPGGNRGPRRDNRGERRGPRPDGDEEGGF